MEAQDMTLPARIKIVDEAVGGGLQSIRRHVCLDLRIQLAERLSDAGLMAIGLGPVVDVSTEQDAGALALIRHMRRRPGLECRVAIDDQAGLDAAIAAGLRRVTMAIGATESINELKLDQSTEALIDGIRAMAVMARSAGVTTGAKIVGALGCPYEGTVGPRAVARLVARLRRGGCAEVTLCDSIGVGRPPAVRAVVQACVDAGVPASALAVHFHDMCGMAVANCLTAIEMGVATVETAVGGLAGCFNAPRAAGTVATEELVYLLEGLGIDTGIDLEKVTAAGRWIATSLGLAVASRVSDALADPLMTYFGVVEGAQSEMRLAQSA
jgi:hydroxymethylglutaryl-CoA lyase